MAGMDSQIFRQHKIVELVIESGSTDSQAISFAGWAGIGVRFPSGWDGGDLSVFVDSVNEATWAQVYDADGTAIAVTGASNTFAAVKADVFAIAKQIRFQAASAVGAQRVLEVHLKG